MREVAELSCVCVAVARPTLSIDRLLGYSLKTSKAACDCLKVGRDEVETHFQADAYHFRRSELIVVVLRFEFHQNRLSGLGGVGVDICPSPLTWPLAYT